MGFSIHRELFRICIVLASCKFKAVGMKEMVSRCRFFAMQFSFDGVGPSVGVAELGCMKRRYAQCWCCMGSHCSA